MLRTFVHPIGRLLFAWKRKRDRVFHGIWMGPPPELLTKSEMACGDVLFCPSGPSKAHGMIREASGGDYSHCAIYLGEGKVAETVPKGGCQVVELDAFLDRYSYIAVTRCPGINEKRRKKIRRFVADSVQTQMKYGYMSAAMAPLRELADLLRMHRLWLRRGAMGNDSRRKSAFCSQFVTLAYIHAGYISADDPFSRPEARTPSGLAEDNTFVFVGYASTRGWAGVSPQDFYLAGCSWVVTESGRAHLRNQQRSIDEWISANSISEQDFNARS